MPRENTRRHWKIIYLFVSNGKKCITLTYTYTHTRHMEKCNGIVFFEFGINDIAESH